MVWYYFRSGLLEGYQSRYWRAGVLHKGLWVATILGSFLGVQDYKKVKFPGPDNLSLAVKGFVNEFKLKFFPLSHYAEDSFANIRMQENCFN